MKNTALQVLRDKFPDLAQWLTPLSRFKQDFSSFILAEIDNKQEETIRLKIFTKENKYSITARLPLISSDERVEIQHRVNDKGYLGCVATTRKPRAGEDWSRGRDLWDGPYSEETWNNIMSDILAYEVVKVVKPQKPKLDQLIPKSI